MFIPIKSRGVALSGGVVRELECGHSVPEPQGGRAHEAKTARCPQCERAAVQLEKQVRARRDEQAHLRWVQLTPSQLELLSNVLVALGASKGAS